MESFLETLRLELERQLNFLHLEISEPVQYSEEAILVLIPLLEKLKTWGIKYKFGTKSEEIAFFRNVKPQFTYKLIYYNAIFNIESNKPFPQKLVHKYYRSELAKLKLFFIENAEFYKYYRRGSQYLDNKYFVRGQYDLRLTLDSFYFQADNRFSTSHDYKVAEILAYEELQFYLETQIDKICDKRHLTIKPEKSLKWTGSKVAIIELLYALHTERVFNNGAADLKDVVSFFSKSFDIDLTQFHRTFFEISSRKSDRTKFLNNLSENLTRRMDRADQVK